MRWRSTVIVCTVPIRLMTWPAGSVPLYLIGALLGRFGKAAVAMPGGESWCPPHRPAYQGFAAMGAEVSVEGGFIHATAKGKRLKGANIYLDVVSVGAAHEHHDGGCAGRRYHHH